MSEENLSDINDIAAVMKLWFRELPEPLLTWELYHGFIEAASKSFVLHVLAATGERAHADAVVLQKLRMTDCGTFDYTSASMTCPTRITRRSSTSWDT